MTVVTHDREGHNGKEQVCRRGDCRFFVLFTRAASGPRRQSLETMSTQATRSRTSARVPASRASTRPVVVVVGTPRTTREARIVTTTASDHSTSYCRHFSQSYRKVKVFVDGASHLDLWSDTAVVRDKVGRGHLRPVRANAVCKHLGLGGIRLRLRATTWCR